MVGYFLIMVLLYFILYLAQKMSVNSHNNEASEKSAPSFEKSSTAGSSRARNWNNDRYRIISGPPKHKKIRFIEDFGCMNAYVEQTVSQQVGGEGVGHILMGEDYFGKEEG